jgi:uncharacterized protein (TIGR01777 family)
VTPFKIKSWLEMVSFFFEMNSGRIIVYLNNQLVKFKRTYMGNVLVTGGAGMIGRHLCRKLEEKGYMVSILSRNKYNKARYPAVLWNPETGNIDPEALSGVSAIIHLAGAGISDQRWTDRRKKIIIDSRVHTAALLLREVKRLGITLESFISSSATGYYGAITSDHVFTEADPPADDFPGTTCRLWEEAADRFTETGARIVKIRTGIVLSTHGGALPKMTAPLKFGICPVLGSGKQWLPWVHLDDLCNLFVRAVEDDSFAGAYNGVAPEPVSMKTFMKEAAKAMNRPFLPLPVPSFLLKPVLGEMASLLLEGSRVSSLKLQEKGFEFRFPALRGALNDIFS